MADETGWMLEKQDKGNNWFLGVVDGTLGWTIDPNKALRLSRRADAEAIAVLCDDVERISEHLWPDMTVPTPQPETQPAAAEMEKAAREFLASDPSALIVGDTSSNRVISEREVNLLFRFALSREREAVRKCYEQCQWGSDKIRIREAYPEHFND